MAIRLLSTKPRSSNDGSVGTILSVTLSEDQSTIKVKETRLGKEYFVELDVATLMDKLSTKVFAYRLDEEKAEIYTMARLKELLYNTDKLSYFSVVVDPKGDLYLLAGRHLLNCYTLTEDSIEPEVLDQDIIDNLKFCEFVVPVDYHTARRRRINSQIYLADHTRALEKQIDIQNKMILEMAIALKDLGVNLSGDILGYLEGFDQNNSLEWDLVTSNKNVLDAKYSLRRIVGEAKKLIPEDIIKISDHE